MPHTVSSDKTVVEGARRFVAAKPKLRLVMLIYAIVFLGLCGYATIAGIRKIEKLDGDQLRMGFVYGLVLAIAWTTFGLLGALCLGKFIVGFTDDYRARELLVRYYDRLRELRDLPDEIEGETDGAANGSQPPRSETNRTSPAPGSGP